jgi:glutamate synthase (NADPH/NADH)
MASEVGVVDVNPADVVQKVERWILLLHGLWSVNAALMSPQGRLKPGRMLLVDTQTKEFMKDDVIKANLASLRPVKDWLESQVVTLDDLYREHNPRGITREDSRGHMTNYKGSVVEVDRRLPLFGWTMETISMLVLPMVYTKYVAHHFSYGVLRCFSI